MARPKAASVMGLVWSYYPEWTKEDIKSGKTGSTPMPDLGVYKPNTYHDFDLGGDKIPVFEPSKKEGRDDK